MALDDDAISRHVEELHTYPQEEIAAMVREHRIMVDEVAPEITMMIDDLYGEKRPIPGHPDHREGGRLEVLSNGGLKLQIPAWLTAILVALVGAVGLMAAAIVATQVVP